MLKTGAPPEGSIDAAGRRDNLACFSALRACGFDRAAWPGHTLEREKECVGYRAGVIAKPKPAAATQHIINPMADENAKHLLQQLQNLDAQQLRRLLPA